MIRKEYYQNPKYLTDLNDFHASCDEIAIVAGAKHLDRFKDLDIAKLWLMGPKEKDLESIFKHIRPTFINIYQLLSKDLTAFETLGNIETVVLRWNTKSERLWNFEKNAKLKNLVIEDFSKLSSVEQLTKATTLDYLVLEGGMWNALKLQTLEPIGKLSNLRFLRLANMKVSEHGLKAIGKLQRLEELSVSNQFETSDYAYLATQLPDTKCSSFKAYIKLDKPYSDGKDVMVTGRRKPFLNSKTDADKIARYDDAFNELIKQFSTNKKP